MKLKPAKAEFPSSRDKPKSEGYHFGWCDSDL